MTNLPVLDAIFFNSQKWKQRFDKVGGSNIIYIGQARPGKLTSELGWQILKITYDISNDPTAIDFANSSNAFDFIWDSRATYTYG